MVYSGVMVFNFHLPPELAWLFPSLPPELWESLLLTLKLALVVTAFLLVIGIGLGYWLLSVRRPWNAFLETLLNLPLVLPPTVLGFYLLMFLSPHMPFGRFWFSISGQTLTFTFAGLVIGSILYSLPYAVQPIVSSFRSIPASYVEAARVMGATRLQTLFKIVIPLSAKGIAVAVMLSFAHTVGEFGMVMMLGGSIPGKTKVASIALYEEVQKLNYELAHTYAIILLVVSFVLLLSVTFVQKSDEV